MAQKYFLLRLFLDILLVDFLEIYLKLSDYLLPNMCRSSTRYLIYFIKSFIKILTNVRESCTCSLMTTRHHFQFSKTSADL